MIYSVFPTNTPFTSEPYNQVIAVSVFDAAVRFANNEESLYGYCDDKYDVYGIEGNLLQTVDVTKKGVSTQCDIQEPNPLSDNLHTDIFPKSAKLLLSMAAFPISFLEKYGFYISVHDGFPTLQFTNRNKFLDVQPFKPSEIMIVADLIALLMACGIVAREISDHSFHLGSKRWDDQQIANITNALLVKCKIHYTGRNFKNDKEWNVTGTIPREILDII